MFFAKVEADFLIFRIITKSLTFFFPFTVARAFTPGLSRHLCFFRTHKPGCFGKFHAFLKMAFFRTINIAFLFTAAVGRFNALLKSCQHFLRISFFLFSHKSGFHSKIHAAFHVVWLLTINIAFLFTAAG